MMRKRLLAIALVLVATAPAEPRVFRLDNNDLPPGAKRFMCGLDGVKLAEGSPRTTVTIIRTGTFSDPRYGTFEITRAMLLSMVRNFDAGTYGQEIFLDVAHEPAKGAAAKILSLKVDGNRLRAEAEFTPYGVEAVQARGFKYLSAEFVDDFADNETGTHHGPTLLGAGLTTRPVIKRMDPVTLAEGDAKHPVFLHPELIRQLSESLEQITMNWLEELKRRLTARKLSEAHIASIVGAYETAAKTLGEDEAAHKALVDSFDNVGKQLAESGSTAPITLSVQTGNTGKMLTESDIATMLDAREKDRTDAAAKLATDKAAKVKLFSDAIAAATGLSDDTRKQLGENVDGLITGEMSDAQVTALAANQIALGNKIESATKLAEMGYPIRAGVTHISVDDSNSIKTLAENVRKGLMATEAAHTGQLVFAEPDKQSPFVKKMLAEFDAQHAHQLHQEAKLLSGGPVNTADLVIPASLQRAVIEQTYQRLDILALVNAKVDPTTGPTHTITYETRDTSAVQNGGIVYEGQPIHRAGVGTALDYSYIAPRKLALEMTNEAAFFSRNSTLIDYDAWGSNIVSNAQVMRELVAAAIANRMLRDSDSYSVVDVAVAAVTAYSGATNGYKVANFPVVRPYQARDLKGNAIGSAEQPITVKDGSTVLVEFNGSGKQAAGTYFRVLSYNLGLFQICDETGAASAPAGTVTIGYSYTTNVLKVDTDIASGSTYEKQMNKLLQAVGARKAMMSQQRYVKPDFFLASDVLTNMITDADQFTSANSRADSGITPQGNLQPVKSIPGWASDAPGIDLGDERMLLGQRSNFWYTVAKTYQIGQPYELFDSNGLALGKKGAYGEEYSSLHVPKPLRGRFTSILAYSATTARGT